MEIWRYGNSKSPEHCFTASPMCYFISFHSSSSSSALTGSAQVGGILTYLLFTMHPVQQRIVLPFRSNPMLQNGTDYRASANQTDGSAIPSPRLTSISCNSSNHGNVIMVATWKYGFCLVSSLGVVDFRLVPPHQAKMDATEQQPSSVSNRLEQSLADVELWSSASRHYKRASCDRCIGRKLRCLWADQGGGGCLGSE